MQNPAMAVIMFFERFERRSRNPRKSLVYYGLGAALIRRRSTGWLRSFMKNLRRMTRRYMRNERPGNTLQTTALVNEVYLRLVDVKNVDWHHRAQFFAFGLG
jgi:hypothetical protein